MKKILELFGGVLRKEGLNEPVVSKDGYIIMPGAIWASDIIKSYWDEIKLDKHDLNKTFYSSFKEVREKSQWELIVDQFMHYSTTYGTDFKGEIWQPEKNQDIPDLNITFKVFHSFTREEIIDKCLKMLYSGIALKQDTINDLVRILTDELNFDITSEVIDNIQNKEAKIIVSNVTNILPSEPIEILRMAVYLSIGKSLLIKDNESINAIKSSSYNPSVLFNRFGLERLAEIFNRFKPLFLAFKKNSPKTVNRISKLSKRYHKPMKQNPLNLITSRKLKEGDAYYLKKATPFLLIRAMQSCITRLKGQETFAYFIRNGKTFCDPNDKKTWSNMKTLDILYRNYETLLNELRTRVNFKDVKFYIPENVEYGIPTSEKMFIGDIPMGTVIHSKRMCVGIYWENEWGARDLDLSAVNERYKIGWNSDKYNSEMTFSGDITNAPNGAVEYLHLTKGGVSVDTIVALNIYSNEAESSYKLIIGEGDDIDYDYMMNPNNISYETKETTKQTQNILGVLHPVKDGMQSMTIFNTGLGSSIYSSMNDKTRGILKASVEKFSKQIKLNDLITELGGVLVDSVEKCDVDLSINKIERDTFIDLFTKDLDEKIASARLGRKFMSSE